MLLDPDVKSARALFPTATLLAPLVNLNNALLSATAVLNEPVAPEGMQFNPIERFKDAGVFMVAVPAANVVALTFVTDRVDVPELNVKLESPAKAPELLYCTCVLDPAGVAVLVAHANAEPVHCRNDEVVGATMNDVVPAPVLTGMRLAAPPATFVAAPTVTLESDVCPVPPLATASVPPSVMAPVVAVLGVSPVVPAEKVVTPPPVAQDSTPEPLVLNTCPAVPSAEGSV